MILINMHNCLFPIEKLGFSALFSQLLQLEIFPDFTNFTTIGVLARNTYLFKHYIKAAQKQNQTTNLIPHQLRWTGQCSLPYFHKNPNHNITLLGEMKFPDICPREVVCCPACVSKFNVTHTKSYRKKGTILWPNFYFFYYSPLSVCCRYSI